MEKYFHKIMLSAFTKYFVIKLLENEVKLVFY